MCTTNFTVTESFTAILFNRISSEVVSVEQCVSGNDRNDIFYKINGKNYSHADYWNLAPIPAIKVN